MGGEGGGGGDQPHVAQGGGHRDQVPHGRSESEIRKISHQTIFSDINFILHTYHFHLHILQIQSHFTEDVQMAKIHNF